MIRTHRALLGLAVATALAATACGSRSGSGSAGTERGRHRYHGRGLGDDRRRHGHDRGVVGHDRRCRHDHRHTAHARLQRRRQGRHRCRHAGPAQRRRLLPGARRWRDRLLGGQRLRGRRSSSTTSRPDEAATQLDEPRPPERRHDHRRRRRDRRSAPGTDQEVRRRHLVLQLWCRLPGSCPNLIQSGDDGSEISYTAGYATGLLMKAKGQTKAAMIGNNNFNFEKESFGAFSLGLEAVDPAFDVDLRRHRLVQRRRRGHRGVQQPQGPGRRRDLPVPRWRARGRRQAGQRGRHHHDERRCARTPVTRTDLKYDIAVQLRRRSLSRHDPRRDPRPVNLQAR